VGKSFIDELTRLFEAFAQATALECIALKAAMTAPVLLLQNHPGNQPPKNTAGALVGDYFSGRRVG